MKFNRCDICKERDASLIGVFIKTGSAYCSMEGHYDKGETVDICSTCCSKYFNLLIKEINENSAHSKTLDLLIKQL